MSRATLSIVSVLSVAGCLESTSNHAPAMEPLVLTTREDTWLGYSLVATDEDGDDLDIQFRVNAERGTTTIRELDMRRDDGTVLEVRCSFLPSRDYVGIVDVRVIVSDGTEDVYVDHEIDVTPVNDQPIAVADSMASIMDAPAQIFASTLLSNDSDPDSKRDLDSSLHDNTPNHLSITSVGEPLHGTVTLDAGIITFTPAAGFAGTASFAYTVSDGAESDVAKVLISVGGPNAAPIANADQYQTFEHAPLVFRPEDLTANDVDHDGQTLGVLSVDNATNGNVAVVNGVVTYVPDRTSAGPGGFDYTVTDGADTATGHVVVDFDFWL